MTRFLALAAPAALLILSVALSGCGGGNGGGVSVPTATPIPTSTPAPTPVAFELSINAEGASNYGFTTFAPGADSRVAGQRTGTDGTRSLVLSGRINLGDPDTTRTRNLSISLSKAGDFAVGDVFPVGGSTVPGAIVTTSGNVVSSSANQSALWMSQSLAGTDGGTVEILALDGASVALRVTNARLLPAPQNATGTLVVSGTASANLSSAAF